MREVVYVGSATRYLVDLDAGATLVALEQNRATSSMDVQAMRGARVLLVWRTEHEFRVADEAAPLRPHGRATAGVSRRAPRRRR